MSQIIHRVPIYASQRVEIQPFSSPVVPHIQTIKLDSFSYAKFFIRKKWAKQGLLTTDIPMPPNWEGVPEIIVHHGGANLIEIQKDEQIGEIWIFKGNFFRGIGDLNNG